MKELQGKFLLIDTNLLILLSKYSESDRFDGFLNELESLNVKSVLEESVLFEYLRGSKCKKNLENKNEFLAYLYGGEKNKLVLQSYTSKQILENAQELAILYSNKNSNFSKQISFVDCLIGAQLMKYEKNLYLATTDIKDFPLFIFDRINLVSIDANYEIINIGIYKFNKSKYSKCKLDFGKS